MKLHEAMEKLLLHNGRPMTTNQIADALNHNGWYKKKDGSKIDSSQIALRAKNYSALFVRNGSMISLLNKKGATETTKPIRTVKQLSIGKKNDIKDEHYVISLCDKVLKLNAKRQHKFDFLLGDPNPKGYAAKLPVDAYYEELKLVIEYCERQHTESINFFDKRDKLTVSGVHRGEQRKIYDERRRKEIPKHGLQLIEFSYSDFDHNNQKRLLRNETYDIEVIKKRLAIFKKTKRSNSGYT